MFSLGQRCPCHRRFERPAPPHTTTASSARTADAAGTGFQRKRLGPATITAVSDGVSRRPLDASFVRNAPLAQVQATLAAQKLPTTHIDVPYTCYVIETQGKRYLLDTGFADNGGAGHRPAAHAPAGGRNSPRID